MMRFTLDLACPRPSTVCEKLSHPQRQHCRMFPLAHVRVGLHFCIRLRIKRLVRPASSHVIFRGEPDDPYGGAM